MCCIRPDQSIGASDREIFNHAMMQDYTCTFQADQVELLRGFTIYNTGEQCLECLGDRFCVVLSVPEDWNNHTFRVWLIQKLSWFTTKKRTITSVCWVVYFLGHRAQRIQIRHNIRRFFYLLLVLHDHQRPSRAEPPPDFFDVGYSNEACELPTNMFIGNLDKDGELQPNSSKPENNPVLHGTVESESKWGSERE
ncbi:hypothetical protein SCLCIDRAFT_1097638 [Scleroderma citrinum Foug A]|uniref:Uncharacterized protein n=1 Tax=Scleroderma citrinum Foug A TaxID=1036808 RepID=A0A0C3DQH5_9AGAM|nr:hypothetical protein SCLCIDRAFT_1097638 [Scleroderma citrinum Foug A]